MPGKSPRSGVRIESRQVALPERINRKIGTVFIRQVYP